jgi:hypothetical protein
MLLTLSPNPVLDHARARFVLVRPGHVTLAIFDVAGREVGRPIANGSLAGGPHELALDTRALRPGVYLARLSAGGLEENRRFVIVR